MGYVFTRAFINNVYILVQCSNRPSSYASTRFLGNVNTRACIDNVYCCSIFRQTVELCQRAVHAGAAWITVHGRTKEQRSQPVNLDAIRTICESVSIPVIANGDICSLQDAEMIREKTGVQGPCTSFS